MNRQGVTAGVSGAPSTCMRRLGAFVISGVIAASLQGCDSELRFRGTDDGDTTAATLESVQLVPRRPDVDGYDRDCGRGDGCVFGPAWSDDVDVEGGHNGCDTRNDILRRDLRDVTLKPGTRGCVVLRGTLQDPYTGDVVPFDRAAAAEVQIDHVYPLAAAWDFGASNWSAIKRQAFANDPRNLIATAGSVNASKGDDTPAEWMPPTGRCRYATAYVDVAAAYDLPVSRADARALRKALQQCAAG